MRRWKLSDEEFIQRVRWWHVRRWKLGGLLACFGLSTVGFAVWFWMTGWRSALDLFYIPTPELYLPLVDVDLTAKWCSVAWQLGAASGLVVSMLVYAGCGVLVAGLVLALGGDRRSALLLKLWDAAHAPTERNTGMSIQDAESLVDES